MTGRHLALPRLWLLTDERQGEQLFSALRRLPRDAGVVVRHYSLPLHERVALARRIGAKGRFVAFSGTEAAARKARAHGLYGSSDKAGKLPRIHPAHNRREIVQAERAGAALLMLSPVFATRSHPGARVLGPARFGLLARTARLPVIALGGMSSRRFRRLGGQANGWAAIDAWIRT